MKRLLQRHKAKSYRRYENILAIDFENEPDGSFICAGLYGDVKRLGRVDQYFTNQTAFDDYMMRLKKGRCIVVTFNLSYDRFYFDRIANHATILANGQRVITMKLKNGLKVYDMTNHVTGSLENWIEYLDMPAKFGIHKAKLAHHKSRVMNDAKATFTLTHFIQDFYNFECGISMAVTIGAAAMRLFTQKYFCDYWEREDDDLCLFERMAYHGGRVELYRRGRIKTWGYDVNSMYVSIMRDCRMPDPMSAKRYHSPIDNWYRWRDQVRDELGIWHCRVKAPVDLWLPVLPVVVEGKLKFPVGEFTGVWTSVELNLALEVGYTLVDVYDCVIYYKSKLYLQEYAEFVWQKRSEYRANGNNGMNILTKLLGNALYGKFAQRNNDGYFGRLEDYPKLVEDGVRIFNFHGEVWIEEVGELVPAKFEFPCISAFVASYGRVALYRAMLANADALIYCDTDSIKLTAPAQHITIGDDLGQWGIEAAGKVYDYHRPKLNSHIHKGVPRRAIKVSSDQNGEVWIYEKPMRYRESIKAGKSPNMWIQCRKLLTYADDKRLWQGDESTPIILSLVGLDKATEV